MDKKEIAETVLALVKKQFKFNGLVSKTMTLSERDNVYYDHSSDKIFMNTNPLFSKQELEDALASGEDYLKTFILQRLEIIPLIIKSKNSE